MQHVKFKMASKIQFHRFCHEVLTCALHVLLYWCWMMLGPRNGHCLSMIFDTASWFSTWEQYQLYREI